MRARGPFAHSTLAAARKAAHAPLPRTPAHKRLSNGRRREGSGQLKNVSIDLVQLPLQVQLPPLQVQHLVHPLLSKNVLLHKRLRLLETGHLPLEQNILPVMPVFASEPRLSAHAMDQVPIEWDVALHAGRFFLVEEIGSHARSTCRVAAKGARCVLGGGDGFDAYTASGHDAV